MSEGGVRLRHQLAEERLQHPGRVPPLPLHLRRHRRPALQWKVLLLHRPQQGGRGGVPVRTFHVKSKACCLYLIKHHGKYAGIGNKDCGRQTAVAQ